MKTLILLAGLLAVVGVAQAELDHDGITRPVVQQQLSKRPYVAPVERSVEKYEGAVVDQNQEAVEKKSRNLQLHRFDRRPYMEKSAD